ncbi:unnamed protein product [Adineta steineri]|uniref:EGF-like domain-containing protein n=1 Tax=Adineta steineri TaxID=433720 RepID=A0A814UX35_9BILA|nr:unnamed protein product [Adineta steineri]CAF3805986.1 unnamed protein product [Adineta steineri]
MSCAINCLYNGTCLSNDTCICPPCFIGAACEISVNVIKFSLTFAMYWDIEQTSIESNFNIPKFAYTFTIALMLLIALVNNIACLQTFFLHDIRLTNCGIFQILYCLTGLITILGMQLRMLTMLEFDSLTQAYSYRYTACNIIPIIVIITSDTCMWLSALLAIEFVLLECFNLNVYRSRWFSIISSILCFLLVGGSHLHEIIIRRLLPDPYQPSSYTCTFIYPLPLDIIDKIFRTSHIIIPCSIHFITSICILTSMTQRILLVYSRHDYFQVFINECIKRKHFFIPPLFIILSNCPHLILHLKDLCEDVRNTTLLRIHIALNILVYLPPSITFFIYIYPSKIYMYKFKKTFLGRWFKRIFTTS